MFLHSCIIFVSFSTLDSQHSTLGKLLKVMMDAPSLHPAVDQGFLVIWSPTFLSHPSSNDPSARFIPLLIVKIKVLSTHQKPPEFTEFLRARATACICPKSSIGIVIASSQLIFEWNLIFFFFMQ